MKALIAKLEKLQGQLPNYGELISKIIFRKKEDREFVLKALIEYLKKNPDIEVLGLSESPELPQNLKFYPKIRFKCSGCGQISEESTNLTAAISGPARSGGKPYCETCEAKEEEMAENAREEDYERQEYEPDESLEDLTKEHEKKEDKVKQKGSKSS